ncbi:hypothetical protein TNCV_850261 [Trichonephila clavipes]|uniref:Uncharacterized protein n=1 Tax=Trichonephila clavipes TaxID=2585209 RepID=A0A8X6VB30_TRICX|nr:hypothetical protein TNCV_850261 [Trichonephila clavipes]
MVKTDKPKVEQPIVGKSCNAYMGVADMMVNLEEDKEDVQELLNFKNQELTTGELIEMFNQEQDIEELESIDAVQSNYGWKFDRRPQFSGAQKGGA